MKKLIMLLIIVLIGNFGCIWIDEDDDYEYNDWNYEETIIYINTTGHSIDNYIDGVYVGRIVPHSDLVIYGYHYDGYHTFFSIGVECEREWGPDEFYIGDGETFKIYLEDIGIRTERSIQ